MAMGTNSTTSLRATLKSTDRQKVKESKEMNNYDVKEWQKRAQEEALKAKKTVEDQVHQNPWAALGIVGLVFFVLGVLFGLKSRGRD
jgi:ElaB/YqjD/DUF883 family membrane-anchored ribosome-binding protein